MLPVSERDVLEKECVARAPISALGASLGNNVSPAHAARGAHETVASPKNGNLTVYGIVETMRLFADQCA